MHHCFPGEQFEKIRKKTFQIYYLKLPDSQCIDGGFYMKSFIQAFYLKNLRLFLLTIVSVHYISLTSFAQEYSWISCGQSNKRFTKIGVTFDNKLIACSSDSGLFSSTDAGTTWTNLGIPHGIYGFETNSKGDIYAASSMRLYISTDFGQSWTSRSIAWIMEGKQISLADNGDVLIADYAGLTRYLSDGVNYYQMLTRYSWCLRMISSTNYILSQPWDMENGSLLFSYDSGNSWQATDVDNPQKDYRDILISKSGNIFVGTGYGEIKICNSIVINVVENKQGSLIASTWGEALFYSNDSGLSWKQSIINSSTERISSVVFDLNGFAFAVTENNGIYRTPTSTYKFSDKDTLNYVSTPILTDSNVTYVQINNPAVTPLILSSFFMTDTNNFVCRQNFPIDVSSGKSVSIPIVFKPNQYGKQVSKISFYSNLGTIAFILLGDSPKPELRSSVSLVSFADCTKGDSVIMTTYIGNTSINALAISGITTTTGTFTATGTSMTIAGRDSTVLSVKFKPTAFGTFTDTVTIVSNGGTVKVAVSGNSPRPTILYNPRTIAFGDVGIYDSAKTILKVANSSVNILIIDSIYTHSGIFTSSPSFSQVTNKDTATITVRFKPVKFGVFSDTLFLRNNSDTTLFTIPLSGETPASSIFITPSSISFGTVRKDSTRQLLFMITNSSISVLQIDSFWTNTKYFDVTHMLAFGQVEKGDSTRVTIRFIPDSSRSFNDTMYIANNSFVSPFKVPLSGNETQTVIQQMIAEIPTLFSLAQNFPNPFNPSTSIQYGLPARSSVRLVIYNVLGQVVTDLVNAEQSAGWNQVVWNANVSSGLYFYRLEATSLDNPSKRFVETKKMLLLR
jgi:hypothetical protein